MLSSVWHTGIPGICRKAQMSDHPHFHFFFNPFLPSSPLRSPFFYIIKTTANYQVAVLYNTFPSLFKPHAASKLYSKLIAFLDTKHPSSPYTLSIGVEGSSCATSSVLRYPHRKSCWQSTCRHKSKATKQLAL